MSAAQPYLQLFWKDGISGNVYFLRIFIWITWALNIKAANLWQYAKPDCRAYCLWWWCGFVTFKIVWLLANLLKPQQPIQTLRLLTGIALLLCLYLFRHFWEDTLVHKWWALSEITYSLSRYFFWLSNSFVPVKKHVLHSINLCRMNFFLTYLHPPCHCYVIYLHQFALLHFHSQIVSHSPKSPWRCTSESCK